MLRLISLFAALSLTVASALANAPPPDFGPKVVEPAPKEAAGTSLPVEIAYAKANGNTAAKIVIPVNLLGTLSQAKANKSFTLPVANAEPGETTTGFPHGGTIVAGLAISLAMVSMIYLVRRKPAHKWAVTGTTVVLLGLGVTSYLWADIRVPGQPYNGPARRPEAPVIVPQAAGPMVTVEIVEKGDKILITVPPQGS